MPSIKTYEKAMQTLEGIEEIVKNEQIVQGHYLDPFVDDKLAESGAICGGHKACLIGSAYIGYGIKKVGAGRSVFLPGVDEGERPQFLRNRPGLKLAIRLLNEAADPLLPPHKRGTRNRERVFESQAEEYFERELGASSVMIRAEVLRLVRRAKRELRKRAANDGIEFV